MKKIKLLIENFWAAPRCFTGDALPRKDILFGKIQLFVAVLLSVQSSAGQVYWKHKYSRPDNFRGRRPGIS